MPLIRLDEVAKEYVTPKHSTAFGELVTGERIEVGRLAFEAGEGAAEHAHPQEQVLIVISGRAEVTLGGETAEVGPGEGFHAPPMVPHRLTALAPTTVISCKSVLDVGHRTSPGETDQLDRFGRTGPTGAPD
jgi:quercetin dioxygenase-like cupin family protein